MMGQIVGIASLFGAEALRDPITGSMENAVWMMFALLMFGTFMTLLLLVKPFVPEYRRLAVEALKEHEGIYAPINKSLLK